MDTNVVIAGFGGQGVLLMGKILAHAGMRAGKQVSWLPSYGPEMRGGTANCTVVISDEPVGSPVVARPRVMLAMNLPSLDKFEAQVTPGGILIINTSLIHRRPTRDDVRVVDVPANEMAMALGSPRSANIVALGAYLGVTDVLSLETVAQIVRETFTSKHKAVELNLAALEQGYAASSSPGKPPLATSLKNVSMAAKVTSLPSCS
jgi:2-oxoglutarate ferredoxin oxidoreductase subunit gamma